jgi:hypothetical protein
MSYREFGSSRQAMRPLRTMLRGHLPEAAMLDNVMRPDYQYRNGSLSIPGGCRNICGVPSPGSARCSMDTPASPAGERGCHHDRTLALRHRRIPWEHEVQGPEETGTPEEIDTSEEEGTLGPGSDQDVYTGVSAYGCSRGMT